MWSNGQTLTAPRPSKDRTAVDAIRTHERCGRATPTHYESGPLTRLLWGCFQGDRHSQNGDFDLADKVEDDLNCLPAVAAGFICFVDNDLLDEFVHDGSDQLGDVHVLFHQCGEAVVVVAVFTLLVDQFFHDGDLGHKPLLLFFKIRYHILIAIIGEHAKNVIVIHAGDQLVMSSSRFLTCASRF